MIQPGCDNEIHNMQNLLLQLLQNNFGANAIICEVFMCTNLGMRWDKLIVTGCLKLNRLGFLSDAKNVSFKELIEFEEVDWLK